jgi:adenylate cyclase
LVPVDDEADRVVPIHCTVQTGLFAEAAVIGEGKVASGGPSMIKLSWEVDDRNLPHSKEHFMSFKQSIAAKIFGLAVFLLLLTVGLALFLLAEVTRTKRDMKALAQIDLPLTHMVTRIHETGMRQRLAFERWFGTLNDVHPDRRVIAEATNNYALYTAKLRMEFEKARSFLAGVPDGMGASEQVIQARMFLAQIEPIYPIINARQVEVIEQETAGGHERSESLVGILGDLQDSVQSQRELFQTKMSQLTGATAESVAAREQEVFWLTIAATFSTVLLGIVVAALITNRLTRPVRSLMNAMRTVQEGNLEVHLPVRSTDEVGALTDSFNYFVQELKSKEQLRRTFGKYIDPRIMDQVLLQPGEGMANSGKRNMTVLFADLAGFSSMSERLTPAMMVAVLNRHFGLQALAVQEHRGVVDKFIGDAVMAFWGPPFSKPEEHALQSCRAALAQLTALETLKRELPDITGMRKDAPAIDLRIGICTGEVVVGNIGSENTRSYTVIGDTVNLASRVEGANRMYGTRILLTEDTAKAARGEFELREIDAITVKGKTEPTQIFELLGAVANLPAETSRLRERYAEALRAYRGQDWETAEGLFLKCLELRPEDGPAKVFLGRIALLKKNPPGEDWNGVWSLLEK